MITAHGLSDEFCMVAGTGQGCNCSPNRANIDLAPLQWTLERLIPGYPLPTRGDRGGGGGQDAGGDGAGGAAAADVGGGRGDDGRRHDGGHRAPAFAPPMAGMRVRHWTPVRAAPPVRPPSLLTHSLAPAFWPRPHKQICMDRGFAPTPIPNPLIGGVKRVSLGTLKQRAATATHSPLQALLAFRENILRNPCAARVCRSPAHFLCAVWRARAL